ncbi:torsin-1A-like [Strongylocentrotus purpuratus]|uniref:Torsin-1A C-terminal domain-containing protein n=1 Tax=Strongylocentrotus purpuratus TaxID=7668 RepID=A0A7M7P6W3_STRPU|nr:torsin-1A-like [Strongylocentrotus purpuratus]
MWGVALYGVFFMLCCGTIECCWRGSRNDPQIEYKPQQPQQRQPPPDPPKPNYQHEYKPNLDALADAFEDHLFGQPLAYMTVLGAIDGHVTNPNPPKPLVLSLHGPAGTGKNHISRLVVENLYTNGMKSGCVTVKMSTLDFPHHEHLYQYKEELVPFIKTKVSECHNHLFIFDEVENMPPGLLDSMRSFLDHNTKVDGVDYRKVIVIFRSNLAAQAINKHLMESYEKGIAREDIMSVDMERIISNEVSGKSDAGFNKARIIDSHLVSHFIPFFPLELSHVRQCIQAEFKDRGEASNSISEDEVLAKLQFDGPNGSRVFAVKGCKNVAEKVNIILYKIKNKDRKRRNNMRSEL